MDKVEIARRVADSHNRLARILSAGGMQLLDADSVILMGDTLKELRALASQVLDDVEAEQNARSEATPRKE